MRVTYPITTLSVRFLVGLEFSRTGRLYRPVRLPLVYIPAETETPMHRLPPYSTKPHRTPFTPFPHWSAAA